MDKLKQNIPPVFEKIISELSLLPNSLYIQDNYSKKGANAGKLISTEIDIQELAYPPDKNNSVTNVSLVLYIKPGKTYYELLIRRERLPFIPTPATATIKKSADRLYEHVLFDFDDASIYDYIEANIIYCVKSYISSSSFGCCSRYKECSNAKKCLHTNLLYATGCQYRKNLEMGNIFY